LELQRTGIKNEFTNKGMDKVRTNIHLFINIAINQ